MDYKKLNQKKGVAGLNVLLSMIAMLFMIGIIVMVFVIASAKLGDSMRTKLTAGTPVVNETGTMNSTGWTLAQSTLWNTFAPTITAVYNTSGDTIASANYTLTGNVLYNLTATSYNVVNVSYTYTYSAESDASVSINATKTSIDDVVDWFPTFVVLGAMIVLILLVVIIINSIKASGITEGA